MYQVFTTAELRRLGLSDREIRAARTCCLTRVARGRFVVSGRCDHEAHRPIAAAADQANAEVLKPQNDFRDTSEQLKVLIRSRTDHVNDKRQGASGSAGDEVFSHLSAALLWDLVIAGPVVARVEVVRGKVSRTYAHLHVRRRELSAGHVARIGDVAVTTVARTLIDVARDYGLDMSVPMIDDALRRGLVTRESLVETSAEIKERRGSQRVMTALELADGRRESAAESVVAVRFFENGITGFEPQVEIRDSLGQFVARVDFLHERAKIVVEFDGRAKYFHDGDDPRRAFDRERERERRLRELGYHVVRLYWRDLRWRDAFIRIKRLVGTRIG